MKLKHALITAASALGIGAGTYLAVTSDTQIQHTSHWKEINSGGNWATQYVAGDTLHFKSGKYTYFSGANMNGTEKSPIVCLFDKGVEFSNGFNLMNCSWWKLDGGKDANIVIKNNTNGVAFNFWGKTSHMTVIGARVSNCYSLLWFKTDPGQQEMLSWDYWKKTGTNTAEASYVMDGLTLIDVKGTDLGFDAIYLGNTQQGAPTTITIDGVKYNVYPAKVSNIQLENVWVENSKRSGIQISGLIGGAGSWAKHVTVINSGTGKEQYQGANFRLGGNSSGGFTFDSCTFDKSWMANVHSQGGGVITMTNTTIKNSCIGNEKMAAVWFDSYASAPLTFNLRNNKIDGSNNGVSVVVYGSDKTVTKNNVFACNNIEGKFQTDAGIVYDTSCDNKSPVDTVVKPPVDTSVIQPPVDTSSKIIDWLLLKDNSVLFYRANGDTFTVKNIDRVDYFIDLKQWQVRYKGKSSNTIIK